MAFISMAISDNSNKRRKTLYTMKNRLQIRYHIPESLPTRAQAMTYLKERFAIGRTNSVNASLPAEPLVLLYNDTMANPAQGITEAYRLATANVLLAIGRGGDGVNVFNNQDYFVIDFAKHDEEIFKLTEDVNGIRELITEIQNTIGAMQDGIKKNSEAIEAIKAEIGVYGDECEKGTIYGYLHCAYDQIEAETNRAEDAEQDLQHAIENEVTRAESAESVLTQAITSEADRAKQAEADLQSHIDTESNTRETEDEKLRDSLAFEVNRATDEEKRISDALTEESDRAKAKEQKLADDIHAEYERAFKAEGDLNKRVDDEILRATTAEEGLTTNLNKEVERATQAENNLTEALNAEIARSKSEDARIEGKLDAEVARATAKDGEIDAKILDTNTRLSEEITRATTRENDLQAQITTEKETRIAKDTELQGNIDKNTEAINLEVINRTNADDTLRTKIDNEIAAEKTARENAVLAEETARKAQDELLDSKIALNANKIKENQVKSQGKTLIVTGPTENGTNLEVNVDNKTIVINETGTLSVASDALVQYAGENAISVSEVVGGVKTIALNINANDKILTNDSNGLLATLSLKWAKAEVDGEKDEIQLIGNGNNIISRIDVADFIKDGMLDNVKLDTTNPESPVLVFTFNSASGKETLNVSVKDLVELYYAGNGLVLTENTFSIVIDPASEQFLMVGPNGLKLTGVQSAIDAAKTEVITALGTESEKLSTSIEVLTNALNTEKTERLSADSTITTDYKAADAQIVADYKAADSALEVAYKDADADLRADFATADAAMKEAYEAADALIRTNFTDADTLIRTDFTNADSALRKDFEAADSALEAAYKTADAQIVTDYKAADAALETTYKAADAALETAYKAADAELKTAYEAADSALESAYKAADAQIITDYKTADAQIVTDYKAADAQIIADYKAIDAELQSAVSGLDTKLTDEITNRTNAIVSTLSDAKSYADAVVGAERERSLQVEAGLNTAIKGEETRAMLVEQDLLNKVNANITALATLNGDVTVDGSVKDVLFDSVLGSIVNTITLEDATEQSLIKKFTIDGVPYVYTSNSSADMKHNGNALNVVIDELRSDVDDNANVAGELLNSVANLTTKVNENSTNITTLNSSVEVNKADISSLKEDVKELGNDIDDLSKEINNTVTSLLAPMQATISALQTELAAAKAELTTVKTELATAKNDLTTLKASVITDIQGTTNEIAVERSGNTATVKFADDAYFVAGV